MKKWRGYGVGRESITVCSLHSFGEKFSSVMTQFVMVCKRRKLKVNVEKRGKGEINH